MKPLRRILLCMSGVMVLLLAAGWTRGCFRSDMLDWPGGQLERDASIPDGQMGAWVYHFRNWTFASAGGVLVASRVHYDSLGSDADSLRRQWDYELLRNQPGRPDRNIRWISGPRKDAGSLWGRYWHGPAHWRVAGLGTFTASGKGTTTRVVHAPYWLLLSLAASPLAVASIRMWIRRRRFPENACPACGYPRGASDRCTECGAVLPIPAAAR